MGKKGKGGRGARTRPGARQRAVRPDYDPRGAAREDLWLARARVLWPAAVAFVRGLLDGSPGSAESVRRQWRDDPTGWWAPHHFRSGMALRNRLRDAGFGEEELGVTNLDNVYVELIEEAAGIPRREVSRG